MGKTISPPPESHAVDTRLAGLEDHIVAACLRARDPVKAAVRTRAVLRAGARDILSGNRSGDLARQIDRLSLRALLRIEAAARRRRTGMFRHLMTLHRTTPFLGMLLVLLLGVPFACAAWTGVLLPRGY